MTPIKIRPGLVLIGVIFFDQEYLAGGPGHVAAAKDVHVQVMHSLARVCAGVDDDAMAAGKVLRGDRGGGVQQVAKKVTGGGLHVGKVLLRDQQQVGGGLGVEVGEGEAAVVLMHGVDRNGVCRDFAEEAVWLNVHLAGSVFGKYLGVAPGAQGS